MIQTILLLLILILMIYKYLNPCERFELEEDPQKPFRNAFHNRFKDDITLIM
jgi:hypothetical protein